MEKTYLLSIFLFLVSINQDIKPLNTLEDLSRYAQEYSEEPPIDNADLFNPDYTTFYQSIKPTLFSRFTHWIGLSQYIKWDGYEFKKLLETVIYPRQIKKLASNQVVHIRCNPDTNIYVWSNIHAAFHSLIRSLEFLFNEKVIDNSLNIIKPNTYFVFNGNSIDYSAYNLETLQVMLLLLKQNPDKVFYLQGRHESEEYWHNITLKTDLEIRAAYLSNESIPLESLINAFFNTLPPAIYFSVIGKPTEVLRISPSNRDNPLIDEQNMGNFFTESTDNPISYHNLNIIKKSTTPIDVKALIRGPVWLKEQRSLNGLDLSEQDLGSTVWTLLSTPIRPNQVYFNLFHDSFALIHLGNTIDESTLTLYQHNTQIIDKFKKIKTFNIVTGIPEDSPAYKQKRKEDIIIGSTMSLKLGVPSIGLNIKRGTLTFINEINKTGGVNGHHIRMIIYNDDYLPTVARENVLNFIKKGITMLLSPVGSPTLEAYTDLVESKQVAVFFPPTGSPLFRNPKLVGLVNWRASYAEEAKALVNYLIAEYGVERMAIFYQDDSYGQGPAEQMRQSLKEKGITTWTDIPYTRGITNLSEHAHKMKLAQPEAVGLFSIPQTTQSLINSYGISGLANVQLFAISPLAEISFRAFIKAYGINILFASIVPNPAVDQMEIVKEYRIAMDKNKQLYDTYSLEGYISAAILINMMQQIEEPITKEKILSKLESLNKYEFKGLTLTFNPEKRDLSQPIWIETGENKEWIETRG